MISTPAISTPAISTPAISTPAISTPAISTPAISTSEADVTIVDRPEPSRHLYGAMMGARHRNGIGRLAWLLLIPLAISSIGCSSASDGVSSTVPRVTWPAIGAPATSVTATGAPAADQVDSAVQEGASGDAEDSAPPTTRELDYPRDPFPLPEDLKLPFYSGSARPVRRVPDIEPNRVQIIERRDPTWFGDATVDVRTYYPGRYIDEQGNTYMQMILLHGDDESTAVVTAGDRFKYAGVIFEIVEVPSDGYNSDIKFWLPDQVAAAQGE